MAAAFSARLGWVGEKECDRIKVLLTRLNLPVAPPQANPSEFFDAMSRDKKVVGGEIRLVLLKGIGSAVLTGDYPSHELLDLLSEQFVH